jgi:hypothetical protein
VRSRRPALGCPAAMFHLVSMLRGAVYGGCGCVLMCDGMDVNHACVMPRGGNDVM